MVQFVLQSKCGYPDQGGPGVLALYIQVDKPDDASQREWSPAKHAVQSLLKDFGLTDAEVEIWDPKRCCEPILLNMHRDDPHVTLYESIRREIVLYVNKELGRTWNSMCLYRVRANWKIRSTRDDVIIGVDPLTHHDWAALRIAYDGIVRYMLNGNGWRLRFIVFAYDE